MFDVADVAFTVVGSSVVFPAVVGSNVPVVGLATVCSAGDGSVVACSAMSDFAVVGLTVLDSIAGAELVVIDVTCTVVDCAMVLSVTMSTVVGETSIVVGSIVLV